MLFELSNYTFQLPEFLVASLFAVYLVRNFFVYLYWTLPFFHMFAIRQRYCDGIKRHLNMVNS